MGMIPYSKQDIDCSDIEAVTQVLRSDFLTQGPKVGEFEKAFCALHEARHAVAVNNATAALHISCLALGVGAGDIVWTSPNSFVASANCAVYCGAEVDFVDIDPHTRNMSVNDLRRRLDAAQQTGRLPKVVIPVDFAGMPCDLSEIRKLADHFGFKVISDSSHAVGASYQGRPIGHLADISVFSFHPVKIITTGEGGMCITDDDDIAQKLKTLRSHGIVRDEPSMINPSEGPWYYEQLGIGFNYRLSDIHAALGLSQLVRLKNNHKLRQRLANRYDEKLSQLPLKIPSALHDRESSHHLYVVEVSPEINRAAVFAHLRDGGVQANVHYIPIHLQPFYRTMGFSPGDFPVSEAYYAHAITLPLYPTLTHDEQDFIVSTLKSALIRAT